MKRRIDWLSIGLLTFHGMLGAYMVGASPWEGQWWIVKLLGAYLTCFTFYAVKMEAL